MISGKVVDTQLGIKKGRLYAFVLTVNGDEEKYQFSKLELPLPANRNFIPFIFAQALLGGLTQGLIKVFGRRLSHFS